MSIKNKLNRLKPHLNHDKEKTQLDVIPLETVKKQKWILLTIFGGKKECTLFMWIMTIALLEKRHFQLTCCMENIAFQISEKR